MESPVKRKGAQDLARYERGTAAKKRKEYLFRQLQETAKAHEEQGDWLRMQVLKYGIALCILRTRMEQLKWRVVLWMWRQ